MIQWRIDATPAELMRSMVVASAPSCWNRQPLSGAAGTDARHRESVDEWEWLASVDQTT